jgi:hypothetical protein
VGPGKQFCTLLKCGSGSRYVDAWRANGSVRRGSGAPSTDVPGAWPVTSSGKAAPGPDPRIRHRTQIDMFRPIRMDHTNCLQVAIKTLQFMVFFRNRNTIPSASVTPTIYSVSDSLRTFTPAPTPRSRSSISPTHNIHTHTLPTPTLLTFTSTEVLWFLPCLTRPRASGVPLDPVQVLLSFLPVQPSVYESFRFLRFNVLNITYQ